MITRGLLGTAGVAAGLWGVFLLVDSANGQWTNLLVWLAGGVILHDAVLAPMVLALGWCAARLLPIGLRGPVVIGSVILAALTLVAVPVLGPWERKSNPGILEGDYLVGWLIVAGVVLVGVALMAALVRWRETNRQDPAVRDDGRTEDGERPGRR